MLISLLIATALNLSSSSACVDTFHSLYNTSSKLADSGAYAQAAALREGAGNLFEDCLRINRAPRDGIYPFDGVGSFLIAATFWHLAGADAEAERTLGLGIAALKRLRANFPNASLTNPQRLYLGEMEKLIREDGLHNWAVWSDQ
jgi:hypothetical protein